MLPRFLLLSLVAPAFFLLSSTASAKRPHVLFIVLDDLGFDDVGFRSHEIKTPTIDGLAAKGIVLDSYYVQDVCSPSRATFQTGRYAMHHSIVDWIPPASAYGLPLNETTLADKMKSAGYATHAVGKWHLGFYKWAFTPTFRGFDSFLGFYSGGEDYFTHETAGGYDMRRDPSPRCGANCSQVLWQAQGTYSTTLFSEEAVRVVGAHDESEPLFLYLAYQGVHSPAEVPQSYIDPYASSIADPKRRKFAGMLSAVDEGIKNVTDALEAKGMLDDTFIVFTSDNVRRTSVVVVVVVVCVCLCVPRTSLKQCVLQNKVLLSLRSNPPKKQNAMPPHSAFLSIKGRPHHDRRRRRGPELADARRQALHLGGRRTRNRPRERRDGPPARLHVRRTHARRRLVGVVVVVVVMVVAGGGGGGRMLVVDGLPCPLHRRSYCICLLVPS